VSHRFFVKTAVGLMRLIGSEPHPIEAKTDLLTYCCTACDEFFVQPIKTPANNA